MLLIEPKDQFADDKQGRLATIGQISAGIAHEIRNPLTAVKGFIQLIQKEVDSRYWDIVNSELDQAISTVQNLLTVSKPNDGEEPPAYISLCALVESTLSLFHNELYRVKVEKRFYNANVKVKGKRSQLKRAVFNLLKNAFEAIHGEGSITLTHYRKDDRIWFIVRDTGSGIPKEKLQFLGTPFFSTKSESGTGLGVTQIYAAFYELGAEIAVDSTEGEGTTFTFIIPVSEAATEEGGNVDLNYEESMDVREFFEANRDIFRQQMELEARTTFEMVSKSQFVSARDLIDHANQIVSLVHDGLTQEIIQLAQERGMVWAKSDIPLITKMEWFYALRKVIWSFLRYYHMQRNAVARDIFELSERINDALDNFIIHFNVSFTKFRDEILRSQQSIIEELTVPVIPIFNQTAVLPLIGKLDETRLIKIEDKLLERVQEKGIQKVFIDLSGTVIQHTEIIEAVIRLVDGVALLGCKAILTGINAPLAKLMLNSNHDAIAKLCVESTLQQALLKESAHLASKQLS
jgi:rsbT co-antagonist protein RsbR